MQDKFNQFVQQVHSGQYNTNHTPDVVEVSDPTNYAQCMDLAYAWCDYIGVNHAAIGHFYAYQIWTQALDDAVKYFDFIPNSPHGIPPVGSIVVFAANMGGTGVAGHVSIGTGKGDTNSVTTYDQNWGTPKTCHEVVHNYDAILGWLVLKVPAVPVITDQTQIDLGEFGVMEVQAIKSTLKDSMNSYNDLKAQLNSCQSGVSDSVKQAVDSAIADRDKFWQPQLDSANQEIEQLKTGLAQNLDYKTLFSIAWKKFWNVKKGA